MSSELSHALLSVIQQASESDVIGPNAIRAKRMEGASNELIVLADVSGSMNDVIGSSGMSKHHHLGIALADVRKYHPEAKVMAFASSTRFLTPKERLPYPGCELGSGTALANALREAATLNPRKTIVISDGLPDNESAALAEAAKITGIVDTIYCGPDAHPAVQFLARLSKSAGGQSVVWDGYGHELGYGIRALIG